MHKIVILPVATADLDNIVSYFAQFYPSTALRVFDDIIRQIELLAEFPNMCEECKPYGSKSYRRMVIGDYLVFYLVVDGEVQIHRILNGKKDIGKYL